MASIYLASRSPRRRELLTQIGVKFEHVLFRGDPRLDLDTSEDPQPGELPDAYVRRVTSMKARAGWNRVTQRKGHARMPVLAADTTVALANEILGKPADRNDAIRMLRMLSGTRHVVLTAVAVTYEGTLELAMSETFVTFAPLDEARILAYVDTGEPFDKAGAYGIQGRAGAFVQRIEGSYTGVVGLPLFETYELLRSFGVIDTARTESKQRP